MRPRDFKDEVFAELARVGKALGSPRRLELLDLLAQGPKPVEALAEQTEMSVANTSQHLQVLRQARLVEVSQEGLYRSYRLAGPEVAALYVTLRGVAERRLAELQAITRSYLDARDLLEGVGAEELRRRALAGEVTVLDVRPAEEFAAGHLPGARSVPLEALECALAELPPGREVVAYCRGPYCVFAAQAVTRLRAAGFRAQRVEQGPADWVAQGLALELGA
ncbi:MAG: metalloregulator ArsR/SmtB family transcription factor [Alphaproteobacteria bacterium]|nr:metalloregulator ArsR/SmtB family transcription factor [Alphaproteobacteria bacterium]MCB9793413.1 metalloregulator ArsR/SmtB family transcription factor [Alphaproteobacteria bacterium]